MDVFKEGRGKRTGLETLQQMLAAGRRPPIFETMQADLAEIELGRAVVRATPGPHANNPIGVIHGGYAATLLDSCCGLAVHSRLDATQGYTTLELKVAYHKAITVETGPVTAEGKVLTMGRRVAFAEARLVDAQGRLLASATSTLLVYELRAD
jgi:uncharacterized protein (TIGR00369 family)